MMKHGPAAMSPSAEDEDLEVDNQLTVTSLSGKPLLDFIAAKKSKKARKRPKWSKEEIERLRSNFVPPDGGYGWFIALGAFTVQFWVAGLIKSYGVIFVEVLLLFPDASASLASWIPAMLSTFCFIFAPVVSGLCQRFSCRVVVFIGGLFCFTGLTLSFFATSLIQLWFTFGVLAGIGAGLSTTPGIIMTSRYFSKRRALANGICLSGTSAGSILLPPLLETLLPEYGFLGSILILGACMLHVCVAASLYRPIELHQWIVETSQRQSGPANLDEDDELEGYTSDANGNAAETPKKPYEPLALNGTRFMNANLKNCIEQDLQFSPVSIHGTPKGSLQSIQFSEKPLSVILEGQVSVCEADNDSVLDLTAKGELRSASFRRKRNHSFLMYSLEDLSTSLTCVPQDSLSHRTGSVASLPCHQSNKFLNAGDTARQPGEQPSAQPAASPSLAASIKRYVDVSLVKNPLFMLVACTVLLMTTGCPHVLYYLPAHTNTLGFSKTDAGFLLSISAIFDLAGRLLSGYVADLNLFKKSHGYLVSMAASAIAVLYLPWATDYWVLSAVVSLYGLALGAWYVFIPILLSEYHGTEKIASSYGLIRTFQGAMALAVPPFAGFLRDVTGSYIPCFLFMGCSMVLGACIMFLEPCAKQLVDGRQEARSQKEDEV